MLTLKFVTEYYLSPGVHGKIDYSPEWPKVIEEPNYDPKEFGQCARGIHVIPLVENPDLTNVVYSSKCILLEVNEEDIIYFEDNGKMRVKKATVLREVTREEILSLNSPKVVYFCALNIDKSPHDDTREAACKSPYWAYYYALEIDKCPHDATREACKGSVYEASYRENVDNESL